MKTIYLSFVFLSSLISLTNGGVAAQYYPEKPFQFGIETSLGLPTKNSPYAYGASLNLLAKYNAADVFSIIASLGYAGLLTKDTSPIADYHLIPLKSTIKIFPIEQQFYASCTVGAGFGLLKGAKPSFIFGGGIGYEWLSGYDLAFKFEGYGQSKKSPSYQPINGQFLIGFSYHF